MRSVLCMALAVFALQLLTQERVWADSTILFGEIDMPGPGATDVDVQSGVAQLDKDGKIIEIKINAEDGMQHTCKEVAGSNPKKFKCIIDGDAIYFYMKDGKLYYEILDDDQTLWSQGFAPVPPPATSSPVVRDVLVLNRTSSVATLPMAPEAMDSDAEIEALAAELAEAAEGLGSELTTLSLD